MLQANLSPALFVILSGCLTFGVPLLLAVRELHLLRRRPNDGGFRPDPAPPPAPKPLPPCLIPVRMPAPPRETASRRPELV
jgi:hypothetical protein